MKRLSADNAEIGLQLIANSLAIADLIEQRKAREGIIRSTAKRQRRPGAASVACSCRLPGALAAQCNR
jgi:hypothetical protein